MIRNPAVAIAVLAAFAGAASAQTEFAATGPCSQTRESAQTLANISAGDTIRGTVTGTFSQCQNWFLLDVAEAAPAIYRHRLVITTDGTEGHFGRIHGRNQSTAGVIDPNSNPLVQQTGASTSPPRFNQWYGFGRGEQIVYMVYGNANTTGQYTVTMSTETVEPQDLGEFRAGEITIGHTEIARGNQPMIWVLDENFDAIPGYANVLPIGNATTDRWSRLTREFEPGTYYIANGLRNVATNLPLPADTLQRNQVVIDTPNAVVAGQPTESADNLDLVVSDGVRTETFAVTRQGAYYVHWSRFTVVDDTTPECPGDFDGDGAVTTADITAFLSAWFADRAAGQPPFTADFNNDGEVTTADITAFLSAWFDARAGGC